MASLSRRSFLQQTSAAAATAPVLSNLQSHVSAADQKQTPPNVLFVLADQWRFSAFGHSTDEVVRTPHIDQLAEEGVNFERAYAANPVCTPNRTCLLTGRHSHQHGMFANNLMLPPEEICWPELFEKAGYATHYVGKWHMDGPAKPGFVPRGWRRRGFQTFEGFNRGHVYHKHWGFDNEGNPLEKSVDPLPNPYYEPILQTDLALDFMEKNKDNPFCCYLSWGPPHTPFNPPKKFERYSPDEIKHRPNVPQAHLNRATKDLVGYYGLCESLDHQMGRLMTYLKDSGLATNTLVIFSSDHGELAGSHGKYRKSEPEDESLHVPLIMRMPGKLAAGQKSQALFNSIDVMPTMLSLCGLEDPGTCTGRDLSAIATGQSNDMPESIYCEGKLNSSQPDPKNANRQQKNAPANTWRTVVTNRHKLIVRSDWDNVEGLYDLHNDPFEMNNLSGDPNHRETQADLIDELRRWAKETGDTFPLQPKIAKAKYTDEEAAQARG